MEVNMAQDAEKGFLSPDDDPGKGWVTIRNCYRWHAFLGSHLAGCDRMLREMRLESEHYTSLLDHAEHFCRGRRPIAIVGHPYSGAERALRSAATLGLTAEVLPASWYLPGRTTGVLLIAPEPTMAWIGDTPLWAPLP
jgi:hypothetical protein